MDGWTLLTGLACLVMSDNVSFYCVIVCVHFILCVFYVLPRGIIDDDDDDTIKWDVVLSDCGSPHCVDD